MSFSIKINKAEENTFIKIMALYPEYMWVHSIPDEEHYNIIFLGEDIEKDSLIQEALMEHLDSVIIDEEIGG